MISRLYHIAQLRLDRAIAEMNKARAARDSAAAEVRQAQAELEDYQVWCKAEKQRLFKELQQDVRQLKSMKKFEQTCNGFKLRLEDLALELQQLRETLAKAQAHYQQSVIKIRQAEKKKEKYRYIDKHMQSINQLAKLRKEEDEIEEVACTTIRNGYGIGVTDSGCSPATL